jgi:hypothetical protein
MRRRRRIFRAFAMVGMPIAIAGLVLCAAMLFLSDARALTHMPRFLAGILAFLAGVQIVAAGLIGELILSLWRGRPSGAARDASALSVVLAGGLFARRAELEDALRKAGVGPFDVLDAEGAAGGGTFLLVEPEGLGDIKDVVGRVRAGNARAARGASGAACAARGALVGDFPGTPRSVAELDAWFAGQGVVVERAAAGGDRRSQRINPCTLVRHFPLFFLARYHARPLHFFGAAGGITAFAGLALGLVIKLSALAGMRRYFLMELALGFAVAGLQLFVTGLLGELLAYVRNAPGMPRK